MQAESGNSARGRCLPSLGLAFALAVVYLLREGTILRPAAPYQVQSAIASSAPEALPTKHPAEEGGHEPQQPRADHVRPLPRPPYEALKQYNRSCSSSREAAEDQVLLFDLQGRRLEAGTGEAVNASVVSWPVAAEGDDDAASSHLLILSRDSQGAVLCQGGAVYVVYVRSDRVRVRPHVVDLGNGLHLVALDLHHFFPIDSQIQPATHIDLQVLVQLRWPRTDFARQPDTVYDHRLQRPSSAPVWGLVLRVPMAERPEQQRRKKKRWCSQRDFRQWDEEDEGRWDGRWVQTHPPVNDQSAADGEEEEAKVQALHSDGWVFERRDCRLQLFSPDEAWAALDGRWVVMLGVSTMQDFIRNLLVDVLNTTLTGREEQLCVIKRYGDMVVTRHYPPSGPTAPPPQQQFRLTWFWIGDWPEVYDWGGGYGTATMLLPGFQAQVNKTLHRRLPGRYSETPDVLLLNTGMHDFITERSGHEDLFERFPWSARPFTKHNFTFAQHKQVFDGAMSWFEERFIHSYGHRHKRPAVLVWRNAVCPGTWLPQALESDLYTMHLANTYAQSSYFGPRGPLLGWHVLDSYSLTYPWSDSSQHSDGAHYGRPDEFSRCAHPPWLFVKRGFVDHVGVHAFVQVLIGDEEEEEQAPPTSV